MTSDGKTVATNRKAHTLCIFLASQLAQVRMVTALQCHRQPRSVWSSVHLCTRQTCSHLLAITPLTVVQVCTPTDAALAPCEGCLCMRSSSTSTKPREQHAAPRWGSCTTCPRHSRIGSSIRLQQRRLQTLTACYAQVGCQAAPWEGTIGTIGPPSSSHDNGRRLLTLYVARSSGG